MGLGEKYTCPDCGKTYIVGGKHVECRKMPGAFHDEFDPQQPNIPTDHHIDDPNISGALLSGIGVGGGVNCYPGRPGSCHDEAYIFVDYVKNPWYCLEKQMIGCPNTSEVIFIGSHIALNYHKIATKSGRITAKIQGLKDGFRYCGKEITVISYRDGVI